MTVDAHTAPFLPSGSLSWMSMDATGRQNWRPRPELNKSLLRLIFAMSCLRLGSIPPAIPPFGAASFWHLQKRDWTLADVAKASKQRPGIASHVDLLTSYCSIAQGVSDDVVSIIARWRLQAPGQPQRLPSLLERLPSGRSHDVGWLRAHRCTR
jgi:hypothetical protein